MSLKCNKPTCNRAQQNGGLCKSHYALATRDIPTGRVDPAPAIAHIKALGEAGVSGKRVGQLCGIPQNNIWGITAGRRQFLFASTSAKILAVPLPDTPWSMSNDGVPVPNLGTQRRLRALIANGYPGRYLAACLEVRHTVVTRVCSGRQPYVSAKVARATAELFKKLQMTPGPSDMSRTRAAAKGWHLPFAWDEDSIDDPDASPQVPTGDKDDWVEDYKELRFLGLTHAEAAGRLGILRDSLNQRMRRSSLSRQEYERYIA